MIPKANDLQTVTGLSVFLRHTNLAAYSSPILLRIAMLKVAHAVKYRYNWGFSEQIYQFDLRHGSEQLMRRLTTGFQLRSWNPQLYLQFHPLVSCNYELYSKTSKRTKRLLVMNKSGKQQESVPSTIRRWGCKGHR